MLKHTYKSHRGGFTLVETLVAISVLVTAIIGPMTIASRGLQSAFYARDELAAVYLAQEGIELTRALRDNYSLNNIGSPSDDWYADPSIPPSCKTGSGCGLDARGTIKDCSLSPTACQLQYDSTASGVGIYTLASVGVPSQYTRVILLSGANANNEVTVSVDVFWQSGLFGAPKHVILQSRIFNPYNAY